MNLVDVSLYGIVDPNRSLGRPLPELAKEAAENGATLIQYRDKQNDIRTMIDMARDIKLALEGTGVPLIINDRVDITLAAKADGVHLGQEDMDTADFAALRRKGVRIGLSTHDESELERALSLGPEYVALGPVYPTLLKKMKWDPQGLERVTRWKQMAGETPLVAIGGLTPERLPGVFAAGADSAAVVTDIQLADDPEARTREWVAACRRKAAA